MVDNDIRNYARIMQEMDLTGLEIREDNVTIRLERNLSPTVIAAQVPDPPAAGASAEPSSRAQADTEGGDVYTVASPMVGVFYAASAENADPFVTRGSRVRSGDTLGIIEAMKLMNEITAEEEGTVEEICVKNGQVVEYGTPLFRLKR
ncbi:MAG: acetyl-CoA carboxylase biotin carboxyl carrier protein [Oscillospiraceae bacterium]|nr:acetyl-CoA carboxylase biotin carboxyl carrier protein [Oscillospiraceae bacterium]